MLVGVRQGLWWQSHRKQHGTAADVYVSVVTCGVRDVMPLCALQVYDRCLQLNSVTSFCILAHLHRVRHFAQQQFTLAVQSNIRLVCSMLINSGLSSPLESAAGLVTSPGAICSRPVANVMFWSIGPAACFCLLPALRTWAGAVQRSLAAVHTVACMLHLLCTQVQWPACCG